MSLPPANNINSFADIKVADLELLAQVEHRLVEIGPSAAANLEGLAGRFLLSAVVFGGLVDPNVWQGWFDSVLRVWRMPSHQRFFYKVAPKQSRFWYPDPVSGCIRAKFATELRQAGQLPANWPSPSELVQLALSELAVSRPKMAGLQKAAKQGPDWLVRMCQARLLMRVPALLANYAAGRVENHRNTTVPSNAPDKVERLAKFIASATPKRAWKPHLLDEAMRHLSDAFFPDDPLAVANTRQLAKSMRAELDKQIAGWQVPGNGDSVHLHFLKWMRMRLSSTKGHAQVSQRPIRPSTARHYLVELAAYNWQDVRRTSIHSRLAPKRLGDVFTELTIIADELPRQNAGRLLAAIESFSHYLHILNPAIAPHPAPKRNEPPDPPRTIVLDAPLFAELLEMLRSWGMTTTNQGEPDRAARARACVVASILMFRTGLRGTEVINLALNDIVFGAAIAELTVRGSAERPNKTEFSRRTLPLHILLSREEFGDIRQLHAKRCDETFHKTARAKLIPIPAVDGLSQEQYLLEPIEAAIRLLVGQGLNPETSRKEKGYWYALASPLRHSFATHLATCLLIPNETIALPQPDGWTPDLVSINRKQQLTKACLPMGHVGLSVMQVVRYMMGHASHTQSLTTYIHEMDWLLAAHLWRDANQPPTSQAERASYLALLPLPARAQKMAVSARQKQRQRNALAQQSALPVGVIRPKRGRSSKSAPLRQPSSVYDDYISHFLLKPAFVGSYPRQPLSVAIPIPPTSHRIDLPDRGWHALHNLFEWLRRGVAIEHAARELALPLADCQNWDDRRQRLAQVKMRAHRQVSGGTAKVGSRRFPQLSSGFARPYGHSEAIINAIWARREQLARRGVSRWVTARMSHWQAYPAPRQSTKMIKKDADFFIRIGMPENWLVYRNGTGNWQPYEPGLLVESGAEPMRLTVGDIDEHGNVTNPCHSEVLYGLLLSLIDSNLDLSVF